MKLRSLIVSLLSVGAAATVVACTQVVSERASYQPARAAPAPTYNLAAPSPAVRWRQEPATWRAERIGAGARRVGGQRFEARRARQRPRVRPHRKIGKPYYADGRWFRPRHQPGYDARGMASWYGKERHGRRTANGEIFDAAAFTGGHPTLPLPSYVEVTNLRNGAQVILRINDRGPFVRGRIVDMSSAAARALGFYRQGTAPVRARYLGPAPLPGERADTNIRPGPLQPIRRSRAVRSSERFAAR